MEISIITTIMVVKVEAMTVFMEEQEMIMEEEMTTVEEVEMIMVEEETTMVV
jgi:hypothetical protein